MKPTEKEIAEDQWTAWLDKLAEREYLVVDDFISEELFETILSYFDRLQQEEEFSKAGIGARQERQVQGAIRGDRIYWLNRDKDEELAPFFKLADELVDRLKRYFFMSISDYEFHLAHYPPGAHYERHIDRFKGSSNRLFSVLVYLNERWKPEDGGELVIYREGGEKNVTIAPLARRLVLFRSETVEHEVLKTQAGRKSLTGWLLNKPASVGHIIR